MRRMTTVSLVLLSLLLVSIASAQQTSATSVPNLIRYNGKLKEREAILPLTPLGITFAIYREQDGGAPVWQETQTVALDRNGDYTVLLGSTTSTGLPDDLFSEKEQRWLGLQVQGRAEEARVLLVSVPYVSHAHETETPPALPLSVFALAGSANTASSGINSSNNLSTEDELQMKDLVREHTVGHGAAGFIPIWLNPILLGTSAIYQNSSGNVGIGTKSPAATLDVNGDINSTKAYQIGGSSVLSIGNASDDNLFAGVGAGADDVAGSGRFNVFSGYQAGLSNSTGHDNTFVGSGAGYSNTSACCNTFVGSGAGARSTTAYYNSFFGAGAGMSNTTGRANTLFGYEAGASNTTGFGNVFSGYDAGISNTTGADNTIAGYIAGLFNTTGCCNAFYGTAAGEYNTTGDSNVFLGYEAGESNTTGGDNTFSGVGAGFSNTTGNYNMFYGYGAGYDNTTGNSNIYFGNQGPASGAESNTIRIGTQGGSNGQQNATYIAGIYNTTASGGVPVYINANGQLGTLTSSLRFKEQVRDMGDSTSALMKLRPVTFLYKPEYDKGERTLQYGLIAEEVAKVYPELVAYDNDGNPYTVRYQYITTMLLNEVQKQHHRAEAQAEMIKAQQQEIQSLKQQLQVQNATLQRRLSRLEMLVGTQTAMIARR